MTMYCETREPHAGACECENCIADRRHDRMADRHDQLLHMAAEQNKSLNAICEALVAIVTMMKERG